MLDGHAELVARAGADGAHLTGIDVFSDAVERLKPERIAGCGGLKTRHDAMVAAERGADYVMFGDIAGGQRPAFEAIVERIEWWAELFQSPCVGFAASLDEVGRLARAGADFVAVGDGIWDHADGAARRGGRRCAAPCARGSRSDDEKTAALRIVAGIARLHAARRQRVGRSRCCRSRAPQPTALVPSSRRAAGARRRHGLPRLPARLLSHRLLGATKQVEAEERPEGHDAARRALR